MSWHRKIWNVLRPHRLQSEIERELRFHIDERASELEAGGMTPVEARRTARMRFGNFHSQAERTRDMDISRSFDALGRNLRYAVRSLAKAPAFTLTVVLTLAIGIGANSAVFSAIYAVLLRSLPYPNAGELVRISQVHPRVPQPFVAPVRLEEWNRLNATFQSISGSYSDDTSELSGELPEKLTRALVAPRFLRTLGVAPALGRNFTAQEERFGGPSAVIISDRLWRRRFNATPDVIGKSLRIGRSAVPIIGVMPPEFAYPNRDVDLWTTSPPDAPYAQNREATWFTTLGRLKPGVTIEQARANLLTVQADLGRQHPKPDAELSVSLTPLKDSAIGAVRGSLWLLYGSVSLLLLIACTNIAALLLSRAAGRTHEIAIRFSLGASRSSMIAQLLTEVFLLALAGAALGLLLAAGSAGLFRSLARNLPRIDEVGLNWAIVLYSFLVAAAVTVLCGLVPALRGTRRPLAASLARGGRSSTGGGSPLQLTLVGVQIAFAVMLLAGAGLLLRSFQELSRVAPGFDPQRVVAFHVSSSWAETAEMQASRERVRRILDGLRAIPGVDSAATAISLPGVPSSYRIELQANGRAESEPKILVESRMVSPDYFAVMRIPILSGELCRDEPGRREVMVNRTFANTFFAGEPVVGRTLTEVGSSSTPTISTIRGIVGDAREAGMDRDAPPASYLCSGATQPGTHFLVRYAGDLGSFAGTVRRTLQDLEPRRSVYGITPVTERISDAYSEGTLRTVLVTFFALTAISLASIGLYGTLSYLVTVRRREVAVRMALGAIRTRIASQFLSQGIRISLIGCIAGLGLSALSNRLLTKMLYGVTAADSTTLGAVVAIVLIVAIAASGIPAIRASRVEPLKALREE